MFPIDDSILSALNPELRASLQDLVARLAVSSPALVYRPVEHAVARDSSHIGGFPCADNFDWPLDKNSKPMVFLAQINFENANSCNPTLSPKSGVLMLFLSADYKSLRAKDQSWYKLLYEVNPSDGPVRAEIAELAKLPAAKLVPESIDHLRVGNLNVELLMEKLPLLNSLPERDNVLAWLQTAIKRAEDRLKDAHQICCTDDEQSREACVMAAFFANGISFDQARKADGHYKHLVEDAASWEVLWRLGGLGRFLPEENRQLFICVNRQNLLEFEFSKCIAVFL